MSYGSETPEALDLAELVATLEAEAEAEQLRRDRDRARELFAAAGKPIPAWLEDES